MWLLQSVSFSFSIQSDPTLERHFKGHRDTVTSVDFSYNMKQIGNCCFILLCVCLSVARWFAAPVCCCLFILFSEWYVLCGRTQGVKFTHLCSLLSQPQALWTPVWWSGTWNLRCERIALMDIKMLSFLFSFLPLATWWPPPPETRLYVFGCPACEFWSVPPWCFFYPISIVSHYYRVPLERYLRMMTHKSNKTRQLYWISCFCQHRRRHTFLNTHCFLIVCFLNFNVVLLFVCVCAGKLSQQLSGLTLPPCGAWTFLVTGRIWLQPLTTRPSKCGPSTGKSFSSLSTSTSTGSAVPSTMHTHIHVPTVFAIRYY